jgi:hypothetical protein
MVRFPPCCENATSWWLFKKQRLKDDRSASICWADKKKTEKEQLPFTAEDNQSKKVNDSSALFTFPRHPPLAYINEIITQYSLDI